MQDENKPFNPFGEQPKQEVPLQPGLVQPTQPLDGAPVVPTQSANQPEVISQFSTEVPPTQPIGVGDQPQFSQSSPEVKKPFLSKKLIAIIASVVLILGLGLAAYFVFGQKSSSSDSVAQGAQNAASTDPSMKPSITASKSGDLKAVCDGKKISNAEAYGSSPHGVMAYSGVTSSAWSAVYYGKSLGSSYDMPSGPTTTDTVLCILPDESTAGDSVTCNLTDFTSSTGDTVTKTYQKVTYNYSVYEAQSGRLVESGTLKSESACPSGYGGVEQKYLGYSNDEFETILNKLQL